MHPTSTIRKNGRVTIPVQIRRCLGLKTGDRVEFTFEEPSSLLLTVRPKKSPFEEFVGILPVFSTKEEILAWLREIRGWNFDGEDK